MTSSSGDHHLSPRSTPHSRPRDAGGTARRHVASFLAAIRGEGPAPAASSPAAGPPTGRPRGGGEAAHDGGGGVMPLDPAGLEAAAKALGEFYGGRMAEDAHGAEAAVRAYLAAVVPVTPTTENPYPTEPVGSTAAHKHGAWAAGFAAGRAAATPDAECPERFPLTGGTLEAVLTVGDIREVVPAPAATPDPPSDRNIARMFHEVYERLAPTFGYRTREESAVPWEKVPAKNRDLMTATVGAVRAHLAAASPDERLREALREIAESDAVDNALDPHRNVRIAQSALAAVDREAPPVPDPETNT